MQRYEQQLVKIILKILTIPDFYREYVPAALQHGGYDYCGQFVENEALAWSWFLWNPDVSYFGVLIGLTAGFTVITSQHYGSGNMWAMRQSVASAAILSAVISVLMTLCSMLMMKQILHLMNTPEDIYQEAYGYIMVICGGIAVQRRYPLASILRQLEQTRFIS